MANSNENSFSKNIAIVDTNPGSGGFYTASIIPKAIFKKHGEYPVFRVSGSADGDGTVHLQYKGEDDDVWTDYEENFNLGAWKRIQDISYGTVIRAIMKEDSLAAGTLIFGFYYK